MEKNRSYVEFKFVDQRYDGIEAWIRKDNSNWIRLDFLLEFYCSGNVHLTKKYKDKLNDKEIAKQYYELLYKKFLKETYDGDNFDWQKYIDWQKNSKSDIEKVRKLL